MVSAVAPPSRGAEPKPQPGTLDHFCLWASRLTLPANERGERLPFVVEPFQRVILRDYFAGIRETFVLLPKGNGKSVLMAALALYHLVHTEEAEAYIFAASRDQATRLLKSAVGFVNRSPGLQKRLDVKLGYREIRSRRDGGTLKVLAADPDTADGIAPTLALCDELHRWRSLEVYTLAKEGLRKRPGRLVGISTAGADEASGFGRMRKQALEHARPRDGAYIYAPAPSGQFVWHEWSLGPSWDIEDMTIVKSANPLSSITVEALDESWNSPGTRRAWWARFICNIWTQDDDAAITAMDWAPLLKAGCEIPPGASGVVIGIDFGWRKDTTVICPVWSMLDDPLTVRIDRRVRVIEPPGNGEMTPEEDINDVLRDFAKLWPDAKVALDPNASGETYAQEIADELGLDVVIVDQQPHLMGKAAGAVMEMVRKKRLEHPGVLEFSSQILSAHLKNVGGGDLQRFVAGPGGVSPDAAIALCLAVHRLVLDAEEEEPVPVFVI